MSTVLNSSVADQVRESFDFDVLKLPLQGPDNMKTPHYGLFRSDTGECSTYAPKKGYVPHQTDDVIALVEAAAPVFGDPAKINVRCHWRDGHYVSVQPDNDVRKSLCGGKENLFPRIVIRAALDGRSFRATLGLYNDLCSNLEMMNRVSGVTTTIRHNTHLRYEMDSLVANFRTLEAGWDSVQKYIDQMRNQEVLIASMLEHLYPTPDDNASQNTVTRHRNATTAIMNRLLREHAKTGDNYGGSDYASMTVNSWRAWNAVQGYVQHEKTRKGDNVDDFRRVLLAAEDATCKSTEEYIHSLIAA